MIDELRILRERQAAFAEAVDRGPGEDEVTAARRLVQVYDGGRMPTLPDHFYLCHPCEVDGQEQEGGTATFDCDTGAILAVDFLHRSPEVGDMAVATAVGGRWVAEMGGNPCKTTICAAACGVPVPGATVTVKDRRGNLVATGTTGPNGCYTLPSGVQGLYTITVSAPGYDPVTVTEGLGCHPTGFELGCALKVCVVDCLGQPYPCGATVTVKDKATGKTLATQAAGPDGCASFCLPLADTAGGLTAVVDPGGDAAYVTTTQDVACSPNTTLAGAPATRIALTPADPTAVCCNGVPVPLHMTLTDGAGAWSFDFCDNPTPGSPGTPGWWAYAHVTSGNCLSAKPTCIPGDLVSPATAPVAVAYFGRCIGPDPVTGKPLFQVTRSWAIANDGPCYFLGTVYNNGVAQPPWIMGDNGAGCILGTAPTHCAAPGAGVDIFVYGDSVTGQATFDPCEPFAVSVPLDYRQPPDPPCLFDGGNTTPGDPVGGGVSIS